MKFIKAVWQAIKNVCSKIVKAADVALSKVDSKDVPDMLKSLAVIGSLAAFGTSAVDALFKCTHSHVQVVGVAFVCVIVVGGILYNYKKERDAQERKDIRDSEERKDIRDAEDRSNSNRKSQ